MSRRQTNGLAGFERDAVRDNAGIAKFGDDPIRQVARSLARAAGEQDDVATLDGELKPFPEGGHVVMGDPEPLWLAAELSHGIREHLGADSIA